MHSFIPSDWEEPKRGQGLGTEIRDSGAVLGLARPHA